MEIYVERFLHLLPSFITMALVGFSLREVLKRLNREVLEHLTDKEWLEANNKKVMKSTVFAYILPGGAILHELLWRGPLLVLFQEMSQAAVVGIILSTLVEIIYGIVRTRKSERLKAGTVVTWLVSGLTSGYVAITFQSLLLSTLTYYLAFPVLVVIFFLIGLIILICSLILSSIMDGINSRRVRKQFREELRRREQIHRLINELMKDTPRG